MRYLEADFEECKEICEKSRSGFLETVNEVFSSKAVSDVAQIESSETQSIKESKKKQKMRHTLTRDGQKLFIEK